MVQRVVGALRFLVMAAVSLVGAHHVASLIGPDGTASLGGDHAGYKTLFAVTVAALVSILVIVAWLNLRRLRRLARATRSGLVDVRDTSIRRFLHSLLSTSAQLALATTIGWVIQENLERVAGGESPTGLGVLDGATISVFLIVAVAVAAVAALIQLGRDVRAIRRRDSSRPRRRTALNSLAPVDVWGPRMASSVLGASLADRAPPMVVPAPA